MIPKDLAQRLGFAAGMRNILVHEYADVDLDILSEAVHTGLDDLLQFGQIIGTLV
jgi:uncharacterized protein YutE (UPF0331/DUF86 family)